MAWLGWILLAVVVLVFSGLLLASRLTPRATGAPGTTLPLQPTQTMIDRGLAAQLQLHPGQTGTAMLNHGLDAFAARAASARAAGRSLDLQYYIWHDDLVGSLLAREVHDAASRGVRVRMLLDDINAHGLDPALMALDAHPNIEIRLYNPFRNRAGLWRLVEMVQRVFSINHRMHNKAWIADGRVAVVGGRNIGNEYFDAHESVNFRDLDLVIAGPAVTEANTIFDDFWNSASVVPIAALTEPDPEALRAYLAGTANRSNTAAARQYLERVWSSLQEGLQQGHGLHWSDGIHVASDPPQKTRGDDRSHWLVERLVAQLHTSRREALLISPYFVPGDAGTDALAALARTGAHVGIVTNSLAANDVPAVHGGYMRYRGRLLDSGIRLHEIRRSGPRSSGLFGSSGASLHTKAFVIDGTRGFVGSFNLDPRSATLNTEMGVLFEDPILAESLRQEYERLASPELSYQVMRNSRDGRLQWMDASESPPREFSHEPDAGVMARITARVLSWLPIESQL
ncbi:MAG TPA: phospholipase D family protein [Lysobacter sp.]